MTWGPLFSSLSLVIVDRLHDYLDNYGII